MNVLVTGGTGRLGRALVPLLSADGHSVTILSRASFAIGDLRTGAGLHEAVAGIDVIVHAASDSRNARAVDVEGTQRLIDVARTAGVKHIVYVSIVGVDRIPFGYYQHKLETERLIAESGVPFSILRATQFHTFIAYLLNEASRYPFIMPIPSGFFVQSVATEEVAARLCRAVGDGPRGRLRDFGGPEVLPVEDVATAWISHTRPYVGLWAIPIYSPGKVAAAFRAGYNTCPDGERGTVTWREWLTISRAE